MCGRYTQTADLRTLIQRFRAVSSLSELPPRYNIAPTQRAPVIARDPAARGALNRLELMRWGLVPSWAQDPSIGNRMINARAETLAAKPSFRRAFERRRCLVAADGFFEWRAPAGVLDRAAGPPSGARGPAARGRKVPMRFRLKGGGPFAFAGLWEAWRPRAGGKTVTSGGETPPGGEDGLRTFCIITTAANALLRTVHDRMPAILRPEDEDLWLDPEVREPQRLAALLTPFPDASMEAYEVSPLVNSPAHDSPECVRPVGSPAGGAPAPVKTPRAGGPGRARGAR